MRCTLSNWMGPPSRAHRSERAAVTARSITTEGGPVTASAPGGRAMTPEVGMQQGRWITPGVRRLGAGGHERQHPRAPTSVR